MLLYHTGFAEIPVPDLRRGRVNADFGQGFYLSDDPAFAERWATEKRTRKPSSTATSCIPTIFRSSGSNATKTGFATFFPTAAGSPTHSKTLT